MIAIFLGMIPLAHWHQDEFQTFDAYRSSPGFFWARLITWSPRPISEAVLYLYFRLTDATGQPWMPEFIGILWLALIGSIVIPVWQAIRRGIFPVAAVCLGLVLLALCITGPLNGEVLYWCQAAEAYIPTIAAMLFIGLRLALGLEVRHVSWALPLALVVAALTLEIGAMFAFAFVVLWIVGEKLFGDAATFRRAVRLGALPLVASLVVFVLLWSGRVTTNSEVFGDPAVSHHLFPALIVTLLHFPKQMISLGGAHQPLILGIVTKVLFLWGAAVVMSIIPGLSRRLLASLSLAALGAAFLSLFGAYYQFGTLCCERTDTLRQVFSYLALLGAAGAFSGTILAGFPFLRKVGTWAMVLCLAGPIAWAAPAVSHDYAHYSEIRHLRQRIWTAGTSPGETMRFSLGEQAMAADGMTGFLPGTYTATQNLGSRWVLVYFGKSELTIDP